MAGHSQFKNIMHRKGAQDAKRAKVFTKLIRELTTAARSGLPDPAVNPRLRAAILAARAANMSRDTIDRAVKRGAGNEGDAAYEEVRYEGYGPGGVALIIETLTDNRNRTAGDLRSTLTKYGGNLGETNSVAFMFGRVGQIQYPATAASADAIFEAALDCGADNIESTAEGHEILTAPEGLNAVRDALEAKFGAPAAAKLVWRPSTTVPVAGESAEDLIKMIEALEDNDDVQNVWANFEIPDELLAKVGT